MKTRRFTLMMMAVAMSATVMTACGGAHASQKKLEKMTEGKWVFSEMKVPWIVYYNCKKSRPRDFIAMAIGEGGKTHYWYLGKRMKDAFIPVRDITYDRSTDEWEFYGTTWTNEGAEKDSTAISSTYYYFTDKAGGRFWEVDSPYTGGRPFDGLVTALKKIDYSLAGRD